MSVALVFASLTICVRLFVPVTAKQLQTLGRGFVTVALVTLPPAATHVFTLLYCVPTRLEATAIRVMDGGDAVLAAAGYTSNSTGLLTVNVLESNSVRLLWVRVRVVRNKDWLYRRLTRWCTVFCVLEGLSRARWIYGGSNTRALRSRLPHPPAVVGLVGPAIEGERRHRAS